MSRLAEKLGEGMHLVPDDDGLVHELNTGCPCRPTVSLMNVDCHCPWQYVRKLVTHRVVGNT